MPCFCSKPVDKVNVGSSLVQKILFSLIMEKFWFSYHISWCCRAYLTLNMTSRLESFVSRWQELYYWSRQCHQYSPFFHLHLSLVISSPSAECSRSWFGRERRQHTPSLPQWRCPLHPWNWHKDQSTSSDGKERNIPSSYKCRAGRMMTRVTIEMMGASWQVLGNAIYVNCSNWSNVIPWMKWTIPLAQGKGAQSQIILPSKGFQNTGVSCFLPLWLGVG